MIDKYKIEQAAADHCESYKAKDFGPNDNAERINSCTFDFAAGAEWAARQIESNGEKTIAYILLDRLVCNPAVERLTVDTQTRAFWPEWTPLSKVLFKAIVEADRDGNEDELLATIRAHRTALSTFLKEKSK